MKYFDEEDVITEYEKQLQKKDNEIERLEKELQLERDSTQLLTEDLANLCK